MNLYEITREAQELAFLLETEELTLELESMLVINQEQLQAKAGNYAKVIANIQSDADAIDQEIKRLKAMKESKLDCHAASVTYCAASTLNSAHHSPRSTHHASRYQFVMGSRLSLPKARGVILTPGGAWRRLYSARSTIRRTSATVSRSNPRAAISSRLWSSST